jgi:hypothetical protein
MINKILHFVVGYFNMWKWIITDGQIPLNLKSMYGRKW